MRLCVLLAIGLLTACASKPPTPTPIVIPSATQVEQGSAAPAVIPAK